MNIHLLSDLHLEYQNYVPDPVAVSQADVVVLAGDIREGPKGIDWAQRTFAGKPVVYVLGNHEYYQRVYPKLTLYMREKAAGSDVHVLENESWVLGDTTFHGATLWTDFKLFGHPDDFGPMCEERMKDYRYIRYEPSRSLLRSADVASIHAHSLQWLKDSVTGSQTRYNVVVSHHAPSLKSLPSQHHEKILAAAFVSDLEAVIQSLQPDLWLHGHIHRNRDYRIGNTRVCCNPRGSPGDPNSKFKPGLILTMESDVS